MISETWWVLIVKHGGSYAAFDRHGKDEVFWVESPMDPHVLRFDTVKEALAVARELQGELWLQLFSLDMLEL